MGMDVGIISIEVLERPGGIVYEFMEHMAIEGAPDAYMFGEGDSWIPFTERQAMTMLDEFAQERGLLPEERQEVHEWLTSLPWVGSQNPRSPHDGGIELYFNW